LLLKLSSQYVLLGGEFDEITGRNFNKSYTSSQTSTKSQPHNDFAKLTVQPNMLVSICN